MLTREDMKWTFFFVNIHHLIINMYLSIYWKKIATRREELHFLHSCIWTNKSRGHVRVYKWFQSVSDVKWLRKWFEWFQKCTISSTPQFLSDFSKLHIIRIIFIKFKSDFMRFQTLFVEIRNRRLKSLLTRFYVISYDCILDFERSGSAISLVNGPSQ